MSVGACGGVGRGQSGVLGYLLVFALVVSAVGVTVVIGGAGLTDTQSQNELERAEHSMTLLDSRAAMVALGDASGQTISLGHDSGQMRVKEGEGWMRITHTNYTEDGTVREETVYNESLGAVVYSNDGRVMAYQGGGVWQRDEEGQAQMVSPPEFHYRGATLTLPIIRTFGDGAARGSVDVSVTPQKQAQTVFPNQTDATGDGVGAPYDETGRNYTNPVRNGTVNVTVKSEYYRGWEHYFRERTTGNVTTNPENQTVKLQLRTISGPPGQFDMPDIGDSVGAGGIGEGHPISEFESTLSIEKNNPHFSYYAEEDDKEFELHIFSDVNHNDCPNPNGDVYLSVYHYSGDGSEEFESWESGPLDPDDSSNNMEWRCDDGDLSLYVDFVDENVDMTYDTIGSDGTFDPGTDDPSCGDSTGVTRGNKYAFHDHMKPDCEGWSLRSSTDWNQHEDSVSYESTSYTQGDQQTMDNVTNHYLELMGDEVELVVKDGPGNSDSINAPVSSGQLVYEEEPGARFVTYLHITENEVRVDLD